MLCTRRMPEHCVDVTRDPHLAARLAEHRGTRGTTPRTAWMSASRSFHHVAKQVGMNSEKMSFRWGLESLAGSDARLLAPLCLSGLPAPGSAGTVPWTDHGFYLCLGARNARNAFASCGLARPGQVRLEAAGAEVRWPTRTP